MKSTLYQTIFYGRGMLTSILFVVSISAVFAQFSGSGSGTEMDPYIITTATHLDEVRNDCDAYYELGAHIDFMNNLWTPACSNGDRFNGSFDGKNFTISNITYSGTINAFFEFAENSTITNLDIANITATNGTNSAGLVYFSVESVYDNITLSGVVGDESTTSAGGIITQSTGDTITNSTTNLIVTADRNSGGIVGRSKTSTAGDLSSAPLFDNCISNSKVFGNQSVGGFAGELIEAYVVNCSSTDSVVVFSQGTGGSVYQGGFVGSAFGTTIRRSYSTSHVVGHETSGGFVGFHDSNSTVSGIIEECYATGNVTSTSFIAGGFVGVAMDSIKYCYSLGDVESLGSTGGFCGNIQAVIFQSYSSGQVSNDPSGSSQLGGFVSNNSGLLGVDIDCYWDRQQAGITDNLGDAVGLTSLGMVTEDNYQNWDFLSVWKINEGVSYPVLENNEQSPAPEPDLIHPFEGGDGTELDPFQIANPEQLNEVRNFLTSYFILLNDLDLTTATGDVGGTFYNGGLGWDPIDAFTGTFDGGGFEIDGLTIERGETDIGLFGSSFGATLQNIVLTDVSIGGQQNVGGLVGRVTNSYINSVGVRGEITSSNGIAGGVVGLMQFSDMELSYSNVRVESISGSNIGGLVGALVSDGDLELGIQNSYAICDLSGNEEVGGITGSTNSSKITNCYYSGFLSSQVSNFSEIYGGNPDFTVVTDSYWNAEANCNISGNTLEELQTQGTYENWDFTEIWAIESGRLPHFQWQGMSEDHNAAGLSIATFISELPDVVGDCQIDQPNPLPTISSCTTTNGVPDVNFPITEEGTTVVTWTFTDTFGRIQTETQNFTVNPDEDAPEPLEATLPDLTNECSVTVVDPPEAEDACDGVVAGVADVVFPITSQGITVVTWTYEDSKGNVATQTQEVIINNETPPTPDLDVLPTIEETCIRNAVSPPTATDNCDNQITGTTDTTFPVTAQGETTITWTYTDEAGNTTTQDQILLISDEIAPVPLVAELAAITTDCDGTIQSATAPAATDNCSGQITGTTNQVFPFTPTAGSQILWQYDDGNGNTAIQFQDIVIIGSDAVTVEESLCAEQEFMFPDGTLWTGEASQVSTLTNQQGCDSLVTTNITVLPEPDVALLGADEVFGCVGEELTFSIDESSVDFTTYTISTLFGNSSTDGPLTFEFSNALAAATTTGDVFVTVELTSADGCIGTDQVQLFDNTIINWGIGAIQNDDPMITISGSTLPETGDSFSWDFGDGTTNTTDLNPTHTYEDNGTYTVTLTVTNECGSESLSSSVTIAGIEAPLGLDNAELHIYPVPTRRFVKIDNAEPITVRIYSLDGRQALETIKGPNAGLDLGDLHSGQYLMKLFKEGRLVTTKKLIKIN